MTFLLIKYVDTFDLLNVKGCTLIFLKYKFHFTFSFYLLISDKIMQKLLLFSKELSNKTYI